MESAAIPALGLAAAVLDSPVLRCLNYRTQHCANLYEQLEVVRRRSEEQRLFDRQLPAGPASDLVVPLATLLAGPPPRSRSRSR